MNVVIIKCLCGKQLSAETSLETYKKCKNCGQWYKKVYNRKLKCYKYESFEQQD